MNVKCVREAITYQFIVTIESVAPECINLLCSQLNDPWFPVMFIFPAVPRHLYHYT
jgi:hypothetical protein